LPSLSAQPLNKEALRFTFLDNETAEYLEITRERIFEGPALYGFMNGGSELFLEYGFQQLLEQRITFKDIPFIAEYYYMDSPQNAYGIYSVHTFRCRRADERFPVECLTPGLLQLYHGYLYLSLKCLDREMDPQPLLDSLSTLILQRNPIAENEHIANLAPAPPPYSGIWYYVCGDLGLSAAHISWAQYFAPYTQYQMWLHIHPETQQPTAQVRFASEEETTTFCTQNRARFDLKRDGNEVTVR
jgi:hypothetical protein